MKKFILYLVLFSVAACKSKKSTTVASAPAPDPVEVGTKKFAGYTAADFEAGKNYYTGYCGMCHGLKDPSSLNEMQWREAVDNMVPKVNNKTGRKTLGDTEKELIYKYVITMNLAASSGK